MRLKNSYFFTLREDAKDEDSISSNLLVLGWHLYDAADGMADHAEDHEHHPG